jgi:geranylgeranyl diphosphate synthase type II
MSQKVIFFANKINKELSNVLKEKQPETLFEPPRYVFSLGGKRIRPILTLMAVDLFGKEVEIALNAALGIEIFHNFSLLHDDLMDNADLRRGNLTVHKKWNPNTAILSGDAMVIESYKYIAKVPGQHLQKILEIFSSTAMDICIGQQLDMDFEQRTDVSEAEYIEMILKKTAVLIGSSLKIGAVLADAKETDTDALYQFGINLGLAFQLKDDLLDVYGDVKTFGKNIGGDIINNKKTYLLIKALKDSNQIQQKTLEYWLNLKDFDPEEKVESIKKIYDQLNLKIITENLIEKFYLASLDCLSSVNVTDESKKELLELSENLMSRNN